MRTATKQILVFYIFSFFVLQVTAAMSRPFYFAPRDDEVTLARLPGVVTAFIEHDNRKQLETERVLKSHHDSIISMQKQISHITCMLILHIRNHNCPLTAHGQVTTTPILSNQPPPGFPGQVNPQQQDTTPWNSPQHSTISDERDEIVARSPTYDSDEYDSEESEDEDSIDSDDSILKYDGFDRMFDETLAAYEKEKEEKEKLRNLPQPVGEDQRHPCVLHQVGSQPTSDPFMTFFGIRRDAMEKNEGGEDCNDQLEKRSEEPKKKSP